MLIKKIEKILSDKRILILGFGREGLDSYLFIRKLWPVKFLGIADKQKISEIKLEKDKNIKLHFGKDYLKSLKNYDVIIKSAGIPIKTITPFLEKRQRVITQTELFFDLYPGIIIGVTGTKGKSTTSSLIYDVLKAGKLKVSLAGNIGKPVLASLFDAKNDEIFVYELSSHQLHKMKKSPRIAVLLNIYPEHLDYYKNFKEYAAAKANITKYQTKKDYLIYNDENLLVKKIAAKSKAIKIPIKGKYLNLDMEAAKKIGSLFKIPEKKISGAIKIFKFLPHRLEFVEKISGIKFYNDSLATIPEATIEALNFLGKDVETLILGGFDRGLDFKNLAKEILKRDNIKNLILFPATGKRIWEEVAKQKCIQPKHFFVDNMKDGVSLAHKKTSSGKICLLSPASPSFGIFKDYAQRGDFFKKYVKKLGKK